MRTAAAVLVVHLLGGSQTQVRPDFVGHWVWNSEHTQAVTGKVPYQPQGAVEWTISRSASALTMIRPWPIGPAQTFVFALDGSESVNRIDNTVWRSRLRWDDAKLIIDSSKVTASGESIVTGRATWVLSMTPTGDLVVESTTTIDPINGRAIVTGGPSGPFVQVFVRTDRQ
jgi:hypothetical protein